MSDIIGVSNNGDISEAIDDAISKAKASTGSTFVEWKMKEVSGKNGGVVGQNEISFVIEVITP